MNVVLKRIFVDRPALWITILIIIGAFFFRNQSYVMYLLSLICLYAIAGQGLDIMVGWTGALMFCPASLAVLGGYASALLVMKAGLPFWMSLIIAGTFSAVISIMVVSVVLLLDEPVDILLVTFAFEEITFHLLQGWEWAGGSMGVRDIPYISIFGFSMETPFQTFIFIACVFCLIWVLISLLFNSRHGKRLRAIKYDPQLLESLGRSATKGRMLSFLIGGFVMGIFGAIYGALLHTLTPAGFTFSSMTLSIFFIIILGGMGTMTGPLLGAALWVALPELFAFIPKQKGLIISLILMSVIILLPSGIAGIFQKFERGSKC